MKMQYAVVLSVIAGAVGGAGIIQALHAQQKPPAYVVVEIDVTNSEAFLKDYAPAVQKVLLENGAKYLARGGKTVSFDGDPPKPRVTILAFDSLDKAQAVYTSAAYRDLRKIGERYAKFRAFAVEGQ